ncbi:hypothetical protein Hanom_Chr08g00735391 [Helianthus anomalus]
MNNLDRPYSYLQLISHLHLKIKTKSKISNFFHSEGVWGSFFLRKKGLLKGKKNF